MLLCVLWGHTKKSINGPYYESSLKCGVKASALADSGVLHTRGLESLPCLAQGSRDVARLHLEGCAQSRRHIVKGCKWLGVLQPGR